MKKIMTAIVTGLICFVFAVAEAKQEINFSQYYNFHDLYTPSFIKLPSSKYNLLSKQEKKEYKKAKNIDKWIEYYFARTYPTYTLNYFVVKHPNHIPLRIKYFYQAFMNGDIDNANTQLKIIQKSSEYERLNKSLYDILNAYILCFSGNREGIKILRRYKNNELFKSIENDFLHTNIGLSILGINASLEQDAIRKKISQTGVFVKEPNFYEIMNDCPYGDAEYWFNRSNNYKDKLNNCMKNYSGKNFIACIDQINKDQERLSNTLLSEVQSKRQAGAVYAMNRAIWYLQTTGNR